jgi:release factor glutamine methyltransferase
VYKKTQVVSGLEIWQWRQEAIRAARATGVPVTEVDWLLGLVANLDRLELRLETFKDWSAIELKRPLEELKQLWQRRLDERLPVQYIAGVTHWRQFQIGVSSAVLIPRPETEYLIDLALEAAAINPELTRGDWVDLGTGSGVIAIGLADAFPQATIHAVDFSLEALKIAQENAKTCGLHERIQFYQGSWWEPLEFLKTEVSGMVSNPPYIPSGIVPTLQLEVSKHEPHLALDGGNDGLDCIRNLVETSHAYLRPGGVWMIEIMAGQAHEVREMILQNGNYCDIEIHLDLAGIERFASALRRF